MPPVMSFHVGSLGFLTHFVYDSHQLDIRRVVDGEWSSVCVRVCVCGCGCGCVWVGRVGVSVCVSASCSAAHLIIPGLFPT